MQILLFQIFIKLLGEIIDFGGSKGKAAAVRKYGEDNVKKAIDHLPKHAQIKKNKALAEDFVNAISNNSKPISNCELGLQVVKILEAAQTSIKNNGKIVLI